jgi:glycosyltransferase involved in cell wall biosynthesis
MSSHPRVSIVMPTYNRKDTIGRAIASVQAQHFGDWELVIVDDGSTDGTRDMVEALDPRIHLIVQENKGVGGARNTGLAASRGELIAFLDSDDAWTPHHLQLTSAFFDAHPAEHVVTTEFWESYGEHQPPVIHPRTEMSEWYPETARRLGSTAFARPPPQGDPYLWYYETRAPLGEWARAVLEKTPYGGAQHYRGNIFQRWRWGWLMAMQPTVITRQALQAVGPIDTSYPIANDFGWLATLCRLFPTNFLSAPGAIKHEYGDGKKRRLSESHLVTGRTATQFHLDVLRFHEELFWKAAPKDPELSALRGFRQSLVARAALAQGRRAVALSNLEEAAHTWPGVDTSALLWLARVPQDRVASLVYRGSQAGARLAGRVRRAVEHATHRGAP